MLFFIGKTTFFGELIKTTVGQDRQLYFSSQVIIQIKEKIFEGYGKFYIENQDSFL